ncbi:lasso peptide isopeptide bond-forming cyclase [Streptomyces sp. NPDC048506]|uniref:lasso peptide isopeptide bond-forming cyclase n=1 Tax=Streptomyces sp. NPDC048506 TaxID=3155028 RepID=UPI00341A78ED
MNRCAFLSDISTWFLVLPDTPDEAVEKIVAKARPHALQVISHPSDRPWLLGRWPEGALTVGGAGDARVAVLGEHAVTTAEATRAAETVLTTGSPDVLDRFAAAWPGSFHLLARSADASLRVQGGVVGVRRVFHARAGSTAVACDRADVLAELLGTHLDEERLALQLLAMGLTYPLNTVPPWRGVDTVPVGHQLTVGPDGPARTRRWWTPPEPDVPLHEGAARFAAALTTAVDVRTRGRSFVTCDLGGLDSTAVCCAAVAGGAKVVAYTVALHDPLADDTVWARRTVEALGVVEHHVLEADHVPLTFEGLDTVDELLDAPSAMAVDHSRRMSVVRAAAERGSGLHLTGIGGDELLSGGAARLHHMVRTRPRTALRHLRGYRAKYRWSRRRMVGQLVDRRSYSTWLKQVATDLGEPPSSADVPVLQWAEPARMPHWTTPEAVAAVRRQILAAAPVTEALAPDHGAHRELATMEAISRFVRHMGQLAGPWGIVCSAPYYDTQVVEAALAIRPWERITPWRYKPLIVEAMRGIVPEVSRARATKANASLEEEVGLREHRVRLLALCEDSRLERLGLIDTAVLRDWCRRPLDVETESALLHTTVACELWLRAREARNL